MPLISLAMIVKNEEAHLAHCLESVKALVDEMVIVDTGSTDRTIEIAREYGAKIYHFDWCDDFSAARNESLKHCTGEWILIMDADEAIDPLDHEKIRNACLNHTADAYKLLSRNYVTSLNYSSHDNLSIPNTSGYSEGSHLPFYSDDIALRLTKNFDGLAWVGQVHEQIIPSIESKGGTIKLLDVVIHHYGKLLAEREKHKTQYYYSLAKLKADQYPTDGRAHFDLMQQANHAQEWEVGLKAAQACIGLSDGFEPFVVFNRALALHHLDRHAEAIEAVDTLLNFDPGHVLALLLKGVCCAALGNEKECRWHTQKAIKLEPTFSSGYLMLARMEFRGNNPDNACKVLLDAIELLPNEPSLYELLVDIELANGRHAEAAEAAMMGLRRCTGGKTDEWKSYVALYYRQAVGNEVGKQNLDLARKMAIDVLEVAPQEAGFYDLLIRIEMARDNYNQASQDAILGIKNCPGGGNGLWHRLAFVYLVQTGETKTARSILQLGLKTFPDDPELKRLASSY